MGQAMSTTQWFIYGKRHFTAPGYLKHVQKYKYPVQDTPFLRVGQDNADTITLKDKVVVITGANGGLGKEMATYAAAKGATLYMICRSTEKAEKARQDILSSTKADANKIKILLADVGEFTQVRNVVKELQQSETRVDCLVCNAGALVSTRQTTTEGHEVTLASHLLGGSYLLSQLLLPQLQKSKDPRCIFVTSGGMLTTKFPDWKTASWTFDDAEKKFDGTLAYAYAKRGQVLLADRLTKTEPSVKWMTAHPGWTATPGVDDAFGDNKKWLEPMRHPWQGAEGMAWLMGAPYDELQSGAFYLDRTPQAKHVAGPFFTEGSYTKNSEADVDDMMEHLKKEAGL